MRKLTAISLFSGCGGFDFGAAQAGIDFLWANDIDPVAGSAYRSIFPDVDFHVGDVRDVRSFPKADVLIGCYPCTGFSLGARRRWKDRTERDLTAIKGNFLYLEFLRVLAQSRPKYFLWKMCAGCSPRSKAGSSSNSSRDSGMLAIPCITSCSMPRTTACPKAGSVSSWSVSVTTSPGTSPISS